MTKTRYIIGCAAILGGCLSQEEAPDDFASLDNELTTRIEGESQSWSASSGDKTSASSSNMRLNANASGDNFTFSSSVAAGTYSVTVRYATRNIYGDYQVKVNGTSVGNLAGYASGTGDTWKTVKLGSVSISGSTQFAFTVTGKNSAATDYDIKIDYVELTSTSGGGSGGSGGSSSGGGTAGSSSTGNTGNTPSTDGTIPSSIPSATGTETRSSTTVLPAGVHNFNNKRIGVQNPKGCDGEGQPAVFELADGATLTNVIIAGGTPGANGVVCKGNCTLQNVYWEDICEDAATNSKDGSVVKIDKVIAKSAEDKAFQHNSKGGSKTIITNSYIANVGKVWRSCGDCSSNGGPRHLELSNVRVEGVTSAVAGANENYGDTVTIRNLFVKGGYNAGSDKPKICQVWKGVVKGNGDSSQLYSGKSQWNSSTCKVAQSDVKSW